MNSTTKPRVRVVETFPSLITGKFLLINVPLAVNYYYRGCLLNYVVTDGLARLVIRNVPDTTKGYVLETGYSVLTGRIQHYLRELGSMFAKHSDTSFITSDVISQLIDHLKIHSW